MKSGGDNRYQDKQSVQVEGDEKKTVGHRLNFLIYFSHFVPC